MKKNPWILQPGGSGIGQKGHSSRPEQTPEEVYLLAFPPAGSGASSFHCWKTPLSTIANDKGLHVELLPVELPGRSSRYKEELLTNMSDVVNKVIDGIADPFLNDDVPIVVLGHSFGGWIAFELVRELELRGLKQPVCLIASAIRSPRLAGVENDIDQTKMHELDTEEFWKKMEERYGPNKELQHPSIKMMMQPILQADFSVSETYDPPEDCHVKCPIFVLGGTEDTRYSESMLAAWLPCSLTGEFAMSMLNGGHHFLFREDESRDQTIEAVLNFIHKSLLDLQSRSVAKEGMQAAVDSVSMIASAEATMSVSNSVISEAEDSCRATVASSTSKSHIPPTTPKVTRSCGSNECEEDLARESDEARKKRSSWKCATWFCPS